MVVFPGCLPWYTTTQYNKILSEKCQWHHSHFTAIQPYPLQLWVLGGKQGSLKDSHKWSETMWRHHFWWQTVPSSCRSDRERSVAGRVKLCQWYSQCHRYNSNKTIMPCSWLSTARGCQWYSQCHRHNSNKIINPCWRLSTARGCLWYSQCHGYNSNEMVMPCSRLSTAGGCQSYSQCRGRWWTQALSTRKSSCSVWQWQWLEVYLLTDVKASVHEST